MRRMLVRFCAGVLVVLSTACSTPPGPSPSVQQSPTPSTGQAQTPSATPTQSTSSSTPTAAKPVVDQAFLDYFLQLALYERKGDSAHVTMWEKPVVTVNPPAKMSSSNRKCIQQTVDDFNASARITKLKLVKDAKADIQIALVPAKTLRAGNPQWAPGFYSFDSYTDGVIYGAQLYIRSTEVTARSRCHSIRVMVSRVMGLMSGTGHSDSVFAKGRTATKYSAEDKRLIELLYSGAIQPGDRKKDVTEAVTVSP